MVLGGQNVSAMLERIAPGGYQKIYNQISLWGLSVSHSVSTIFDSAAVRLVPSAAGVVPAIMYVWEWVDYGHWEILSSAS